MSKYFFVLPQCFLITCLIYSYFSLELCVIFVHTYKGKIHLDSYPFPLVSTKFIIQISISYYLGCSLLYAWDQPFECFMCLCDGYWVWTTDLCHRYCHRYYGDDLGFDTHISSIPSTMGYERMLETLQLALQHVISLLHFTSMELSRKLQLLPSSTMI